jgi:tRNA (guanine-N7-)-methyltransferase
MRMRKKPNMPQRVERCAAVYISDPEAFRGQWLGKLPGCKSLHLEIGCGRGRFTNETALLAPDALLVAIERVPEALIIGMERAVREEIPNVRFIETDADRLGQIFVPGEVDRIYINFCDPWPGNRHTKRRLTHSNYLELYKELLRPGGEIHFKTDNGGLFDYSVGQFELRGFELYDVTRDLHRDGPAGIMTDYEQKFYEQGVSISRCVARLNV